MRNNRTLLPIRFIVESIAGASIDAYGDGALQYVEIARDEQRIVLQIGNPYMSSNIPGKETLLMDIAPISLNGRTMAPIRYIAEALGCRVDWDAKTSTVRVIDPSASSGAIAGSVQIGLTTVSFGGKEWIVIGFDGNGVASAKGTVTVLLADGYSFGKAAFNSARSGGNAYFGSDFQSAVDGALKTLSAIERSRIKPREINGGAAYGDGSAKVAGEAVPEALFWPLSVAEAERLNRIGVTLANSSGPWWLRSPGGSARRAALVGRDGDINSEGEDVGDAMGSIRPACILNLSPETFAASSVDAYYEPNPADVAIGQTKIFFGGLQWTIIGYDGQGTASKKGTMTLLLADMQLGDIQYDAMPPRVSEYGTSGLRAAMDKAAAGLMPEERALIVARTLLGGAASDGGERVAGDAVEGALFWPLSAAEAGSLGGDARSFQGHGWWLRSAGSLDSHAAAVGADGAVSVSGVNVRTRQAIRPACILRLAK
jgi:hypothetical protein